jgi:uncharacterized protein YjiS (DUF1127 family)
MVECVMTAIRLARQAESVVLPDFRGRAAGFLDLVGAQFGRWLRNRRGERQLSAMGDDQLRDLGITRADIVRAAWNGRD